MNFLGSEIHKNKTAVLKSFYCHILYCKGVNKLKNYIFWSIRDESAQIYEWSSESGLEFK